ncbi:MAG: molybdopterin-dependent oxidoreductase [Actinomycetota bacterium]
MATRVARPKRRLWLTPRQVNLLLEGLVLGALASGLASWLVPLSVARPVVIVHALCGLLLLVVAPFKVRGPVRSGFRRRQPGRWVSAGFGVLVVATVGVGMLHATGAWFGVGYWSALWTHQLFGFALLPLLVWHLLSRPVRPAGTDLDRRAVLTTGAAAAAAAVVLGVQESVVRAVGSAGAERAGTGSHAVGSFDPSTMPTVQWLDDVAPTDVEAGRWALTIAGAPVDVTALWDRRIEITARLDCTGGWFADQRWLGVPLADLLPADAEGRSIVVTSATGYRRRFPLADAADLHLAVGYEGRPLRRGHGAPVRLVAPDRRGPHWVKWVVDVAISDRPSWLQLPLPPT